MPQMTAGAGSLKGKMKSIHFDLNALRDSDKGGQDVSLSEFLKTTYETEVEKFLYDLGVNPNVMTVFNVLEMDEDTRWVVPELFREAINKGFTRTPWYPEIVSGQETVSQPNVTMPFLNLSEAEPEDTEEAETISEGTVSYGSKDVKIGKHAIGMLITDEALQYSRISLLSKFLQDIGIKLGLKLNRIAITALISGDQADGSESAAVIGVDNTVNKLVYKDEVRVHVRGSMLGRLYNWVIANEDEVNHIMLLDEHKTPVQGSPLRNVNLRIPLPRDANLVPDGNVPAGKYIFVDPRYALILLVARALTVEGERIVRKQVNGSFASVTAGFANLFRDGRVVVDQNAAFSGNGFPSWMTPIK